MRKFVLLFTIVLISTRLLAQTEKPNYKIVADKFESFYNAKQYDSIFAMFSVDMKAALPIDQTIEFLAGLQSDAGKMIQRKFRKYEQSFASYKTTFEKALFKVNISVDGKANIDGLSVDPLVPAPERNITPLQLPFKGEWTVVWGGDTKALNYHVESEAQKNAFDIIITNAQGKSFKTDGKTNEDYYAFSQPLIAPCAGEVVLVVDGVKDNKPGELNPIYVPGNTVIIKTDKNEYLFFAHFKQHSIKVKQGQKVKTGQLLGLCGNSGNSSEAHLHFHIQHMEDMTKATGIKCYFSKLLVNGQVKTDYSPIQKEKIKSE
jgi:murein DD-endopeptidase MepM/ murein hydrolase activator NlpD